MTQGKILEYDYIFEKGNPSSKVTLLLLHGTGDNEYGLLDLGKKINPGANIISPRGNVLEGKYNRFFERLSEGVFNEEDIKKRSKDLVDFLTAARDKYDLQDTQVVAIGYSNGANIAASILLLYPTILSGAILLRAMLPLYPKVTPNLSDKAILLLSGMQDRIMNETQVHRLAELLKVSGARFIHKSLNTGHGITLEDVKISSEWITSNFKNI